MMRYYITGRADKVNVLERTLVIHGKGEMPAPRYKEYHPWRYSPYIGEIKTVIICDGVTSIAKGAFCGAVTDDEFFGNPFESVKRFVIKSAAVTVAPDSPDISGIECGITYEY